MRNDLRLPTGWTINGGSKRNFFDPGSLRIQGYWTMDNGRGADTTRIRTPSEVGLYRLQHQVTGLRGDHIELGNRIYAATLGARFDVTGPEEEPTYSEEDARYLQGLPEYSSGRIHLAFGTAAVDLHGTPTPEPKMGLPSRAGTTTLLDKDILKIILCTQQAEQG